ncbi:hypothetical protein WMY93_033342 [Mugilogobius chulae]|uniref:Uncharacterized protein n=1 Tax=Mugilogobius chulae TaxID=88201 RepID=A0AAW0MN77_9GOBI
MQPGCSGHQNPLHPFMPQKPSILPRNLARSKRVSEGFGSLCETAGVMTLTLDFCTLAVLTRRKHALQTELSLDARIKKEFKYVAYSSQISRIIIWKSLFYGFLLF